MIIGNYFYYRNVITLPAVFTLDLVLLQPNVLGVAQTAYDNYMRNVSKGPEDLPPILEINAELVGITFGSGQARIILHDITAICHEEVNIENDNYSDADDFNENVEESTTSDSEETKENTESQNGANLEKLLKPLVDEQVETQFELELEPQLKKQLKTQLEPIENKKYLDAKIFLQQFDKDFKAYDSDELSETEIIMSDLYDCPIYKTAKHQKAKIAEIKSFFDQY